MTCLTKGWPRRRPKVRYLGESNRTVWQKTSQIVRLSLPSRPAKNRDHWEFSTLGASLTKLGIETRIWHERRPKSLSALSSKLGSPPARSVRVRGRDEAEAAERLDVLLALDYEHDRVRLGGAELGQPIEHAPHARRFQCHPPAPSVRR